MRKLSVKVCKQEENIEIKPDLAESDFYGNDSYSDSEYEKGNATNYMCKFCGLVLKTEKSLVHHEQGHINLSKSSSQDENIDANVDSGQNSNDCSKNTSEDGSFRCKYCDKVLKTLIGLKIHSRRHTGKNLHVCNVIQLSKLITYVKSNVLFVF